MILPVVTLKFAPFPAMVVPIGTAAAGKRAAAGDVAKTVVAAAPAPVQKVAASAFHQLVAQIVAESADPEDAPTPAVPTPAAAVKLPPKATIPADQSSELPAPVRTAPAPSANNAILFAAPTGARRAATANPSHAQPPSAPVETPIPIAPKLRVPFFAGGGSPEQKPATPTPVSNAEETTPIKLEPKPILELKIRLIQPAAETPVVQNAMAPVASSFINVSPVSADPAKPIAAAQDIARGVQDGAAAQKTPDRASAYPEDADARPSTEPSGHPVSRTVVNTVTNVVNQEAVAIAQQPAQPLVHDPASAPVAALPAPPPVPAPIAARSAAPEPQTTSAPPRGEFLSNPIKTQQPLRSMALEFNPDGLGDIKVRLSERAGDVHISLHGTDSLLAGRVREGVSDLVGSLSKAGYDAEAWTPGEGRQNQRQQPDRRQPAPDRAKPDPEDFGGILQQPIQEIS